MKTEMHNRKAPESLPLQNRAAPVGAVDATARTAEVVFSTGASVRRQRWAGWDDTIPFDETLIVSKAAINLDRLNAGAPALDSHSAYTTSSQVGVIENPRVVGGEARATVRFPSKGVDVAADRMFAMVSEGIIRNVSVGYSIDEVEVHSPSKAGEVEQRIVKRWTPWEISFVTIPADAGAQVRAADEQRKFPLDLSGLAVDPARADGSASAARMRMRQASA
jgi:hypothetical protein